MKIQKLVAPLGVTALAIGMAAATVAPASAINNIKPFGQPESLNDATGAPMITYTVHGLNPSSDAVFHNGQLYEANVTFEGGIPIAPMFNARAESGANYRVIGGGSARQALLRRRGRCTEQRRLQRRCPGSSDVDSRPSGGGTRP